MIVPFSVNAANDCSPSVCRIAIDRVVSTTSWGVTVVRDNFTLTSTAPVTHVSIGIPSVTGSHLKYAVAVENSGQITPTSLQVSNLGSKPSINGNYTSLDVVFPNAKTGQYTFNLTTVYSGLLAYNQTASSFQLTINPYPMNDGSLNVTLARLTINRNDWSSPRIQPGNQTLSGQTFTTTNWAKYNTTTWRVLFPTSGTTQTILDTSAGRLILISSDGSIQVTDNYNFTNRGPPLASISLLLPKAIASITVADAIGPLANPTVAANPNGTSTLTFAPRYSSYQIQTNQTTKVVISYQLSKQNYVSTSPLDLYTLNFRLFDGVKFSQPTLTTKIVTPTGFKLKSLTSQQYQTSGNQIILQTTPLTPVSNLGFSMSYQLDPFWASISPLGWILLLEAAVVGAVIAVRERPVSTTTGLTGQPDLINRFVQLYEEKTSMRLESEKIEEDVNRGAMNRADYRRRTRTIDLRMNEIDRTLVPVKEQLAASSPRFQDMIRRIERTEAELQSVRTTGADMRNQYRSGRMSRELYDSLSTDLVRRKERAQQTIDSVIISLREEIR